MERSEQQLLKCTLTETQLRTLALRLFECTTQSYLCKKNIRNKIPKKAAIVKTLTFPSSSRTEKRRFRMIHPGTSPDRKEAVEQQQQNTKGKSPVPRDDNKRKMCVALVNVDRKWPISRRKIRNLSTHLYLAAVVG